MPNILGGYCIYFSIVPTKITPILDKKYLHSFVGHTYTLQKVGTTVRSSSPLFFEMVFFLIVTDVFLPGH